MKNTSESSYNEFLQKSRLPFKQSKAQAWQAVKAKIENAPVISIQRKPQYTLLKVAAAAILLLAGAGFSVHFGGKTTFENGGNQAVAYQFPDGSSLHLNEASTVEFNKWIWQWSRTARLSGEAFFEVKKGSNFVVNTTQGSVRVLGTSFNVKTNDHTFEVQCKTGRVAVDLPSESHELLPGNGLLALGSVVETYVKETKSIGNWVVSQYKFEDIAIAEVFELLSREIGYQIEVKFESSARYTGQFASNENVHEMMEIICKPLGFDFQIDDSLKHILILKK